MKKILIALVNVGFLVACGTAKSGSEAKVEGMPSKSDVARVQDKFPGYTLDELVEGKKLYENNCALCHGLKKLNSQTEEGWRKVVPPMVKKANNKNGNALDEAAQEKILRYVITMGPALEKK